MGEAVLRRDGTREDRQRREHAADWAFRMAAPTVSASDRAAFEAWLRLDPRHADLHRKAEALLRAAPQAFQAVPPPRSRDWTPARHRVPVGVTAGLVAAALALFVVLDGPMRLRADAIADHGESPALTLSDGSVVHLDASSAIAVAMDGTERRVRLLRGEAFFEVASNPDRPFLVQAANGATTALGTAFDVRLADGGAEVTVTQHAVSVAPSSGGGGGASAPVTVREGQRVAYDADGRIGALRKADAAAAASWRSGLLVIDDEPLASVIERIGRHSPARIVVVGDATARRRISGTFDIRDPLAAITVLERSLRIRSTRLGSMLVILHD